MQNISTQAAPAASAFATIPLLSALSNKLGFTSSSPTNAIYGAATVSATSSGWLSKQLIGTLLTIIASLLVLEQAVYRYKKAHLPGAKWTIPIIGKFKDSMDPRLEGYKRQWASGALSVTSVFNM